MQTPDVIAANWASRLGQSTQRITDGVNSVTVSPGAAAARQKALYLAQVTASADKWARRVAAVSTADWQGAMISKGIPRIAQGAQASQGKFAAFMGRLLPHIASGVQALPARGNLEANIARSAAFARHMASFQNTGR